MDVTRSPARGQMMDAAHDVLPLRTVARLTGLSPDVIRAWEKRYGVVTPVRGPRRARLYTAADVETLRLLQRAVAAGRAIGDVARLDRAVLTALSGEAATEPQAAAEPVVVEVVMADAMAAVATFDAGALQRCLGLAAAGLGPRAFVRQVATPLLVEVGTRWEDGRLSVRDEHLVSGLLHSLLASLAHARSGGTPPTVLLATPAGERHELGLLMAGLLVAEAGLRLCYLGPDLPAEEIAAAAVRAGADVVGLGLVLAEPERAGEVAAVEQALPPSTELWLGGRAASVVASRLPGSRALVIGDDRRLDTEIARLRALRAARA